MAHVPSCWIALLYTPFFNCFSIYILTSAFQQQHDHYSWNVHMLPYLSWWTSTTFIEKAIDTNTMYYFQLVCRLKHWSERHNLVLHCWLTVIVSIWADPKMCVNINQFCNTVAAAARYRGTKHSFGLVSWPCRLYVTLPLFVCCSCFCVLFVYSRNVIIKLWLYILVILVLSWIGVACVVVFRLKIMFWSLQSFQEPFLSYFFLFCWSD